VENGVAPEYTASVATRAEKGNALEAAVAAIEARILRTTPGLSEKTFLIESKKIINAGGVPFACQWLSVHVRRPPFEVQRASNQWAERIMRRIDRTVEEAD
jgi:hypothetical protein